MRHGTDWKSFVVMGGIAALLVLTIACRVAAQAPRASFLALLPLTGSGADQGEWCRRGMVLAEEELRRQGISNVVLNFEDSRGDPKLALEAFTSAVAREPVQAVLTWGSGVGMVLSPEVNRREILQMGVATVTDAYRSVGDFTFRVLHSASLEGEYMAQTLQRRQGSVSVALLAINNDYGVQIARALRDTLGRALVYDDTFAPGSNDMRAQLLKIRASTATDLVLISYPVEGALALKQLRQSGLELRVLAAGAIYSGRNFFDLAGQAGEGVEIVLPRPSQSEEAKSFAQNYQKRFGEHATVVNHYAARSYDALKLLVRAMQACQGWEARCVRDQLFKVQNYEGASGRITFDQAGDVTYPLTHFRIQGNEFLPMGDEPGSL